MCSIRFLALSAGRDDCCRALRKPPARTCGAGLRARRGFTLGELLVAVAVAGLLAAIAYPSYVGYKVRANRAAAQSFLIDLANRQQLYFLDTRRYAGSLAALGADPVPPPVALYYVVADPVVDNAATPPGFLLAAMARPGTIQAGDGDLGLDSTGNRSGHW